MKHSLDRAVGLVVLVALAPLILLVALAVKLEDGGPVFFRQFRVGRGQRPFRIWKFRTMHENADQLLSGDERVSVRRVTRVGHVLRSLSLDELPQALNVLRGEMSLVGPRPVLVAQVHRYQPEHMRRFAMRPGITGLAQVNGRNTLPWSRRLALDVEYVDTFSLWLDVKILVRTIRTVTLREGLMVDRNPEQVDDLPRPRP